MKNLLQLKQENIKLERQLSQYKEASGLVNYMDDSTLRGGYRIVESTQERDSIDCCHRKIGMIVSVEDDSVPEGYRNYRLIGSRVCANNWIEVDSTGVAGPPGEPGPEGQPGPQGPIGDLSILNFNIDNDMHLIMQLETNTNLDFNLDNNGHLILIN